MKRRDVGTIGENEFISWCEPEGFKWTRPSNDRLGWDFILEREPEPRDDLPLDRQNELPKFLVQIKSTDRLGEPPRIKLSALKHLVDADMPAVIIILEFGKGARQPKRCRVVTVDAQLISYALHRTRQREAAGKRSLRKERVRIPLDRAIELSPTGEGLSKTLDHMVGGSFSDYVKDKIRIRETCGYDEDMATGRFVVRGKDAKERIQNLLLGMSSEIDVVDLTIENRRFGISLANDTSFFDQAILKYHAPALRTGTIELEEIEEGDWTRFSVELYAVPPMDESDEKAPVRLANPFFEVILDFEKEQGRVCFDYDGSRTVDLDEAVAIIEVGAILARSKRELKIEIDGIPGELRLAIEEGQGGFWNWIPVVPMLRRIRAAMQRHNPTTKPALLLSEFFDWIDKYRDFLALGSTPGATLFIPHRTETEGFEMQDTLLAPLTLELAGAQYTALIEVPVATMSSDESEFSIVCGKPHVVDDIVRSPGTNTDDFIDRSVRLSKRNRNAAGPALVVASFENWAKG